LRISTKFSNGKVTHWKVSWVSVRKPIWTSILDIFEVQNRMKEWFVMWKVERKPNTILLKTQFRYANQAHFEVVWLFRKIQFRLKTFWGTEGLYFYEENKKFNLKKNCDLLVL
jgi:hypothetical protein